MRTTVRWKRSPHSRYHIYHRFVISNVFRPFILGLKALVLSENNRFLFVVNPGSDDISVFAVTEDGLRLIDRESSGGRQPISVTVHGNSVYVLNAGGNLRVGTVGPSDNISGFNVHSDGSLSPLGDSTCSA